MATFSQIYSETKEQSRKRWKIDSLTEEQVKEKRYKIITENHLLKKISMVQRKLVALIKTIENRPQGHLKYL